MHTGVLIALGLLFLTAPERLSCSRGIDPERLSCSRSIELRATVSPWVVFIVFWCLVAQAQKAIDNAKEHVSKEATVEGQPGSN